MTDAERLGWVIQHIDDAAGECFRWFKAEPEQLTKLGAVVEIDLLTEDTGRMLAIHAKRVALATQWKAQATNLQRLNHDLDEAMRAGDPVRVYCTSEQIIADCPAYIEAEKAVGRFIQSLDAR